jgi:hypothetical protein
MIFSQLCGKCILPIRNNKMRVLTTFTTASAFVTMSDNSLRPSKWPTIEYRPRHASWPYKPADFTRSDESSDGEFYDSPRFVTHIDDHAIGCLRKYYDEVLPGAGRILDFCSSWISHYPKRIEEGVANGDIAIVGMGMNAKELQANPVLQPKQCRIVLQDLNQDPDISKAVNGDKLDAATCVVSIDYLTRPREVLETLREVMHDGGSVHLIISNRCFPTKVTRRWLTVDEEERLLMVGDYLHFSGWSKIEILKISDEPDRHDERGGFLKRLLSQMHDPLWVVRAVNEVNGKSMVNDAANGQ